MPVDRKRDMSVITASDAGSPSKRLFRTARLNHKYIGKQTAKKDDSNGGDLQDQEEVAESTMDLVCIECPPALDDEVMLELPHKTDRVILKTLKESSTSQEDVICGLHATLVDSVQQQLEKLDPDWKEEIMRECKVIIEGSILQGTQDGFNKAISLIQRRIREDRNKNESATCVFCLEKFTSIAEKAQHIQDKHKPEETVDKTPKFSEIKWDQVLRIIDPPPETISTCTVCKIEVDDFIDHFFASHPETLKCFHCHEIFENDKELSAHQMKHINEAKLLLCVKCEHEGNFMSMKHHVPTTHKDDLSISSVHSLRKFFKCPSCKNTFISAKACTQHMVKCNQMGPSINFDDYMIEIDPDLEEQKLKILIIPETDSDGMQTECPKCTFKGTRTELQKHMKEKHPEKLLKCEHCVQSFKTLVSLSKHTQTHFDRNGQLKPVKGVLKKLYKCVICGFTAVKYGMNMHLTRAHGMQRYNEVGGGETQFECSICGKEFQKKSAFQSHEWRCKKKGSRLNRIENTVDEVDKLIQKVKGDENNDEGPKISDRQVLRYDEEDLTEEEKRKIVSYGIEIMPEKFPDNGLRIELKHIYQCKDCSYISTFHGVTQHRRRLHRQPKYKCLDCPRTFVCQSEIEHHKKNCKHNNDENEKEANETFIVGNKCLPMTAKHRDKIVDQLKTLHECRECGFKGIYDEVSRHIKSTHLDAKLCCIYCEKFFTNPQAKKAHEKLHIGEDGLVRPVRGSADKPGTFACQVCNKEFKLRQQLQVHEARKHGTTEYPCKHCSKSYTYEMDLINHMKIKHSDTSAVVCQECGSEFACQAYLTNHMRRVHSDKGWLQCDVCLKMCRHAEALKKHKKLHQPEDKREVFKCLYCPREFLSELAMRDHANKHSGEQPYSCSQCNERFSSASNLSRHKRKKHRDFLHSCPYYDCSSQFFSVLDQVKHLNSVHTNTDTLVCGNCNSLFVNKEMLDIHDCAQERIDNPEDGEITLSSSNVPKERADAGNDDVRYMCGQCDVIMSSWEEMEEHATVCGTEEELQADEVIVFESEADLIHMVEVASEETVPQ